MFARTVTVDGRSYTIWCTPTMPYSEVLRRAADVAHRKEIDERENDPNYIAYRKTVADLAKDNT